MFAVFLKELRQFRRSFFLTGIIIFQVLICGIALAAANWSCDGRMYREICGVLGMLLSAIVISCAGGRWHRELGDDSLDIRLTTPLPPWSIIAGKVTATGAAAALPVVAGFIFIAVGPGGMEPFLWQLSLPAALTGTVVAAVWMLAFSTLRNNLRCRRFDISGVIAVICVLSALGGYSFLFNERSASVLREGFWKMMSASLLQIMTALAVMYGAIAPERSNRILPLRSMMVICAAAVPWIFDMKYADILWFPAVAALLVAAVERISRSRRVIRTERSLPVFLRPLHWLFASGAVNGIVFSLLFTVLIACCGWCNIEALRNYGVIFFYVAIALNIRAQGEERHRPSGSISVLTAVLAGFVAAGCVISIFNPIGKTLLPLTGKPDDIPGYAVSIIMAAASLVLLIKPFRLMLDPGRK